jgi:hypothetical protein
MTNWPDLLWQHDGDILRRDDNERLQLGDNNGHRVVEREKLVGVDLTVAGYWRLARRALAAAGKFGNLVWL